eukprot:CAMPEP_0114239292 /NCGR_PEP_ID=MMETSP0058-20121206/8381_1 /TAXON_ID=36894 /ORGANISM="Pyramimonas parkeae, CCMP726" /LENGTH=194 /DNA_ID=CAMNT_0001351461 /DNA_START=88 /DNA_END=672 /DNA_ORIENTATION=+
MDAVLGVPVGMPRAGSGESLPQVDSTRRQRFFGVRSPARGPQNSRIFAVVQEGCSAPAFYVEAMFPARATVRDSLGRELLCAKFTSGLGFRRCMIMLPNGQLTCQATNGLCGGTTVTMGGPGSTKYKLKGSTKYWEYMLQGLDSGGLFVVDGGGAVDVSPGTDPIQAVLLAIICKEIAMTELGCMFFLPHTGLF